MSREKRVIKSSLYDDLLLSSYIDKAYSCACNHGFHEKELSLPHVMMLVISEVGEMVEADRKMKRANVSLFEFNAKSSQPKGRELEHRIFCFKEFVKDSYEDEMSDVAIRIFDICGMRGIEGLSLNEPTLPWDGFRGFVESHNICECCYELVGMLSRLDYSDVSKGELRDVLNFAFCFLVVMSEVKGIDLKRHIELKMEFNESRPMRNGKTY